MVAAWRLVGWWLLLGKSAPVPASAVVAATPAMEVTSAAL
jgi:hypothetical protein